MQPPLLPPLFTINVFGSVYIGVATGIMTYWCFCSVRSRRRPLPPSGQIKLALSYARPIYALMTVLTPIIFVVGKLANGILFLLHMDPNAKQKHHYWSMNFVPW